MRCVEKEIIGDLKSYFITNPHISSCIRWSSSRVPSKKSSYNKFIHSIIWDLGAVDFLEPPEDLHGLAGATSTHVPSGIHMDHTHNLTSQSVTATYSHIWYDAGSSVKQDRDGRLQKIGSPAMIGSVATSKANANELQKCLRHTDWRTLITRCRTLHRDIKVLRAIWTYATTWRQPLGSYPLDNSLFVGGSSHFLPSFPIKELGLYSLFHTSVVQFNKIGQPTYYKKMINVELFTINLWRCIGLSFYNDSNHTHLALSGKTKGANTTSSMGVEVYHSSFLQSLIHSASHGRHRQPMPKYRAMDMLATHVRCRGPTYSNTGRWKIQLFDCTVHYIVFFFL